MAVKALLVGSDEDIIDQENTIIDLTEREIDQILEEKREIELRDKIINVVKIGNIGEIFLFINTLRKTMLKQRQRNKELEKENKLLRETIEKYCSLFCPKIERK